LGGLLLFTLCNVVVISFGIKNGIERANKYMMPLLFIFFLIIVVRALTLEGAMEGVKFFLAPDFSSITGEAVLYALGQSFFLLAGLAVFPVVFALGMEPTEGPGLLFMVLPAAFGEIPFGAFFLSLFLILFLFATLTSSFSLYEIIVSAFTADGKRSRTTVTMMLGAVLFIVAIPAALSDSLLSDVSIAGKSIFDATDYLVSNIILPLGSLLIALFIAYKMDKTLVKEQYHIGSTSNSSLYGLWRVLMSIVVPLTIIVVYLNMLGIVGGTM